MTTSKTVEANPHAGASGLTGGCLCGAIRYACCPLAALSSLSTLDDPAPGYLKKIQVTPRNARIHVVRPLKLPLARQIGHGLSLERASASALVKSFNTSR